MRDSYLVFGQPRIEQAEIDVPPAYLLEWIVQAPLERVLTGHGQ